MTEQATSGPWFVTRSRQGGLAVNNHKNFVSDFPIAEVFGPLADAQANADLIAEAGTVKTECGLSPRQLLEQRNALLAGCKEILEELEDMVNEHLLGTSSFQPTMDSYQHVRDAIHLAEKS